MWTKGQKCAQRLLQLYSAVGIIFIAFEWDVQMQLLTPRQTLFVGFRYQRNDMFDCILNSVSIAMLQLSTLFYIGEYNNIIANKRFHKVDHPI